MIGKHGSFGGLKIRMPATAQLLLFAVNYVNMLFYNATDRWTIMKRKRIYNDQKKQNIVPHIVKDFFLQPHSFPAQG